jgi:archaellum component FlaF (FlaF/FlaG flagellin family)
LIVHDIISKSYQKHTYNYIDNFDNERHIDLFGKYKKAYPLVNTLSLTKDGKNVSSFPSKQYLQPTVGFNTDESYEDDFNQYSFTANRSSEVLQSRGSQMSMLESALQLSLDVVGNTTVSVGDIIELKIPNTGAYKSTEDEKLDVLYNGNFMIRSLRHDFDITINKHTMSMNVTKDSIGKNLFAPTDNTEPKSESPPKTIIEDWGDPA